VPLSDAVEDVRADHGDLVDDDGVEFSGRGRRVRGSKADAAGFRRPGAGKAEKKGNELVGGRRR